MRYNSFYSGTGGRPPVFFAVDNIKNPHVTQGALCYMNLENAVLTAISGGPEVDPSQIYQHMLCYILLCYLKKGADYP